MEREDVTVYELNVNYRNGKQILEFARRILQPLALNYQDNSIAFRNERGKVHTMELSLNQIAATLKKINNYGKWFILCRTNQEVEDVCYVLKKNKIPFNTFKQADLSAEEIREKMAENRVKVLTIHSAKGLENDNVIVIGARFWNDEERRIAYVAATRARDLLIWTKKPKKKKVQNWE